MTRTILKSKGFVRDLRKWVKSHPDLENDIESAVNQLAADDTAPSLKSHKLKGTLAGLRSCSAGYDLRIVYKYAMYGGAEAILLVALGTHDEMY